MTTISFDTLIKTLKSAGFEKRQAEAQTELLEQVVSDHVKELATKRDIAELKAETIQWMFGVATGQAMFIIAILKMFPSR
ncbi:MAG: DUF1640 domain-containing protein [Magnetococcales bacterium]|nr:DUF1640 domain-containing protein [Magnetococcales bacterium]